MCEDEASDSSHDMCHKCGSISGVYYNLCDDCMTRFNRLEASDTEEAMTGGVCTVIAFRDQDDKEVGRLSVVNGKLTFSGTADESAKLFFDSVSHLYDKIYDCKHGCAAKDILLKIAAGEDLILDGIEVLRASMRELREDAVSRLPGKEDK